MCTEGPVMIRSAWLALRPQNEQRGSFREGRRRT
jgi:hypothetical protein